MLSHTFFLLQPYILHLCDCSSTGSSTGRMAASLPRVCSGSRIALGFSLEIWEPSSERRPSTQDLTLWALPYEYVCRALVGLEFMIPFLGAGTEMCFTFVIKPVLRTHSHFIYCWTVSAHHQGLSCFSLCSYSEDIRNRFFFFKSIHYFLDSIPFLSISPSFYKSSLAELWRK